MWSRRIVDPGYFCIDVYTELRKTENGEKVLYRADPCYIHSGAFKYIDRNDWALFRWQTVSSSSDEDVPAKLLAFFRLTQADAWFAGDSIDFADENDYVTCTLCHSLHREPSNYFDVTKSLGKGEEMAHPASRLIFKASLEMESRTLPENKLLPTKNIVGPALVVPDVLPVFSANGNKMTRPVQTGDPGHEHLIIRSRRQWSEVIQAIIQGTYSSTSNSE